LPDKLPAASGRFLSRGIETLPSTRGRAGKKAQRAPRR
jgi:hypothetical protein